LFIADASREAHLEPLDLMAGLAALVPPPADAPDEVSWGVRGAKPSTRCGGRLKIIASIEEPEVIARILAHLGRTAPDQYQARLRTGTLAIRLITRTWPAGQSRPFEFPARAGLRDAGLSRYAEGADD